MRLNVNLFNAIGISRRMRRIGLQSGVGGMVLSLAGMGLAAFGWLIPLAGAITQEVIDVIVVMNSLRTIWKPKVLTDVDVHLPPLARGEKMIVSKSFSTI